MRTLTVLAAVTPLTFGLLWEANSERHRIIPTWLQAVMVGWLCMAAVGSLPD